MGWSTPLINHRATVTLEFGGSLWVHKIRINLDLSSGLGNNYSWGWPMSEELMTARNRENQFSASSLSWPTVVVHRSPCSGPGLPNRLFSMQQPSASLNLKQSMCETASAQTSLSHWVMWSFTPLTLLKCLPPERCLVEEQGQTPEGENGTSWEPQKPASHFQILSALV